MTYKPLFSALVICTVLGNSPAFADPWHKFIDKPWKEHKHKHKQKEVHVVHHYPKHRLPKDAILLAIAGVTYALIDGHYYEQKKDQYVFVEKPPKRRYQPGKVIRQLPEGATAVNKRGQQYFVSRGNWFLSIGNGKYVVVEP